VQDRGYPDISGLASGLGTGTAVIVQRKKRRKRGKKYRNEAKKVKRK
jgi:hypothetical protein